MNDLNLDSKYCLPHFKLNDGTLEGGDTGHNFYTMAYCAYHDSNLRLPISIYRSKQLLFSPDGWPRRHPDRAKWYGQPGRCSRDLLTPTLCYFALPNASRGFWPLVRVMATRGFLFANNYVPNYEFNAHKRKLPDLLGPDVWSVVLRGAMLRSKALRALWPVLCLLDVHGLLSACYTLWGKRSADQRNQALKTHFAANYLPTPVSKLAMFIYQKSKPRLAFCYWWRSQGEPRIDRYMRTLYR